MAAVAMPVVQAPTRLVIVSSITVLVVPPPTATVVVPSA